MLSPLLLERWTWWRPVAVGMVLVLAATPDVPLVWNATSTLDQTSIITSAFRASLVNAVQVAFLAVFTALLIGLPLGVLAGLYSFPLRKLLLVLHVTPLLLPSHLLAIAWSSLAIRLGLSNLLSGITGCVLVFASIGVSIVVLATLASCNSLSQSQIDAARASGGEGTAIKHVARHAFYPAVVAATLSGILSLSDPGPGQIFGLPVAASEILTSFAVFFDFGRAGKQCLILSGLTLCAVAPVLVVALRPLANEILTKQMRPMRREWRSRPSRLVAFLMIAVVGGQLVFPMIGLILPVLPGAQIGRAWDEVLRTYRDTIVYAIGAGLTATLLGVVLACCAGRSERLRRSSLALALALLALPPSMAALGVISIAGSSPEWTDPLLRSRLTVSLTLGIRFFPIGALLALRSFASIPANWSLAAAVHGISFWRYAWKILIPYLAPALLTSILAVALLGASDIVLTLLLHPPGASSLPLSIFTIMANAPESIVATLCLVYVVGAAVLLGSIWRIAEKAWK